MKTDPSLLNSSLRAFKFSEFYWVWVSREKSTDLHEEFIEKSNHFVSSILFKKARPSQNLFIEKVKSWDSLKYLGREEKMEEEHWV